MEARIHERGTHAIATLPHRSIRETDHRELWKSSANIDFHLDQMRIDSDEGSAQNFCKHGSLRSKARVWGIIGILSNCCNQNYKGWQTNGFISPLCSHQSDREPSFFIPRILACSRTGMHHVG